MNAKLGQHLTLLGICSLVFTLVMVALGKFSAEVLPQFLASSIIFLVAGRCMRGQPEGDADAARPKVGRRPRHDADWPWLARFLNWTCALLLLAVLAIALAKPVGVSFGEAFGYTRAHENFFAGAIP